MPRRPRITRADLDHAADRLNRIYQETGDAHRVHIERRNGYYALEETNNDAGQHTILTGTVREIDIMLYGLLVGIQRGIPLNSPFLHDLLTK